MAVVEDVTEEDSDAGPGPRSTSEMLAALRGLSKRLALPEELLPSFMNEDKPVEAINLYHDYALGMVREILPHTRSSRWAELSVEDQGEIMLDVLRLYGHDPWTSTALREVIDDIISNLSPASLAIYLLNHPLRSLFSPTPHPMLNPSTSRALPRPAGGADANLDFHDSSVQRYKSASGWGCYNVLSWCTSHLPPDELERRIGVILPPTLVMMDDWEPPWRGRGVRVLEGWMEKIPVETMGRMGMDKLLLNSLIHTLSLHANPPLRHVLPVTLRLLARCTTGQVRAERYAEIMDKAVVQRWIYAPSGQEGRAVVINIAEELEVLCTILGTGITRWLKTIIPNLLGPLQYPPSVGVLPHLRANLSALLCIMRTLSQTGRIGRWRGQIMDVLSRLWLQLRERGAAFDDEGGKTSTGMAYQVERLLIEIFAEIQRQRPSVCEEEYNSIVQLDPAVFQELCVIPVTAG